ncbi:MAG: cob(I)yrinic acid a,c-diamide adenosyltransferase [Calditrichaceae bacterium]
MKIYTGYGDEGNTALFGGDVVQKDHPRVELYGTLDELNSIIGLLRSKNSHSGIDELLFRIQYELFVFSAEIATPDEKARKKFSRQIAQEHVNALEDAIDFYEADLEPLKNFILPGGSEAAAIAHLARTVCRRAERIFVKLRNEADLRKQMLIYLNRLSDLLFIIARFENKHHGTDDVKWEGNRN